MSAGFQVVLHGGLDAPKLARRVIAASEPALPRAGTCVRFEPPAGLTA